MTASALAAVSSFIQIPVSAQTPAETAWPTEGWVTADPTEAGVSSSLLEQVPERMAIEAPLLSGLAVARNGILAGEWYQNGFSSDDTFHVWSVSKSITSIAVGLALEEELLPDLDMTLGELIPDRIPANVDPRVYRISVRHLLTMMGGWAWDGRINFSRTAETDDLDLMLTRPMNCDPGVCFEYDSGCSNLLSYIVQTVSGELMVDYLNPRLFVPLGMEKPDWIVTDDGANRGGGGAYLTVRDMAKFGLLYARGGKWKDQSIVSGRWVYRSTHQRSSGIGTTGGTNIGTGPYGYHWWINDRAGVDGFSALGYGGQVIYAVPSLDLVVAAGYSEADATRADLQQRIWPLVDDLILPAALAG